MMERRSRQRERPRWKRAIMLALVALVLICSPLFAWSVSRPDSVVPVARVVVRPGDTLWDIAREYGPAHDRANLVERAYRRRA